MKWNSAMAFHKGPVLITGEGVGGGGGNEKLDAKILLAY
jgi:hypothetical protein